MKVCEYSFRDLDREWVGIDDKKICKKIGRKIKMRKLQIPIFGYFYIDKEDGLSLRIVGNIEKDGRNKLYLDENMILNKELVLNYPFLEKVNVTILNDDVVKNMDGANLLENKIDSNYKDINNFLMTRDNRDIDKFRNDVHPDDVQVLLINHKDVSDELLWARIEGIMDTRKDVFICKLITPSYYNSDYQSGTMIGVKYFVDEDRLKVVGLLKKREK